MNSKRSLIIIIIIGILLITSTFFGLRYFLIKKELKDTQQTLEIQQINEKVLKFTKLFIENVLKAETEVGFETRLKLENAVRDLKDEEILGQWQKFTESKTEVQAQEEVKNLLEMLVNKIRIK